MVAISWRFNFYETRNLARGCSFAHKIWHSDYFLLRNIKTSLLNLACAKHAFQTEARPDPLRFFR